MKKWMMLLNAKETVLMEVLLSKDNTLAEGWKVQAVAGRTIKSGTIEHCEMDSMRIGEEWYMLDDVIEIQDQRFYVLSCMFYNGEDYDGYYDEESQTYNEFEDELEMELEIELEIGLEDEITSTPSGVTLEVF